MNLRNTKASALRTAVKFVFLFSIFSMLKKQEAVPFKTQEARSVLNKHVEAAGFAYFAGSKRPLLLTCFHLLKTTVAVRIYNCIISDVVDFLNQ